MSVLADKRVPFAVLVVDVSEDWEEVVKDHERGYAIDFENFGSGGYKATGLTSLDIEYPHGSVRAGFNAIIDTVRIAYKLKIPTFAVHTTDEWSDGDEVTCESLQSYIPKEHQAYKGDFSAFVDPCRFEGEGIAAKIERVRPEHLMILGYDRDHCVLATVKDAVARGYKVVTSEHCMLTKADSTRRDETLAYYREHTQHIEALSEVWNYLWSHRCLS
ncbi:isochorismatase family protein [Candidatus Kaiserbacteria bacterium]|nr:isochorismatase family protein [Candidatus Kaiserbacteria bacterium]